MTTVECKCGNKEFLYYLYGVKCTECQRQVRMKSRDGKEDFESREWNKEKEEYEEWITGY